MEELPTLHRVRSLLSFPLEYIENLNRKILYKRYNSLQQDLNKNRLAHHSPTVVRIDPYSYGD